MPFGFTSVPLLCDHIIKAQLREGVGGGVESQTSLQETGHVLQWI